MTARVELISWPQFRVPASLQEEYSLPAQAGERTYPTWSGGGQDLVEFAGRACYQSWGRPNPATATNEGYLAHILDVKHGSVLEHANYTFYLTDVSRSLTHELVRHRHLSYSQLSQRYVDSGDAGRVDPGIAEGDSLATSILDRAWAQAQQAYEGLVDHLTARLEREEPELSATARRKRVRQAARAVLPNMTETKIVVTGNLRAWRHFIAVRANEHADEEICALAVEVFVQLRDAAPNAMQDGELTGSSDGPVFVRGIAAEEGWR